MSVGYDEALVALQARLGEQACAHSVRVAETAEALALIYFADADKAKLAGLLHDWDREVDHARLPDRAREAGVPVTAVEEAVPYLLHAHTGAAAVREEFSDIDPEVLRAIEAHTIGSRDMSDLDKVVYIADMIEPGRRFPGVNDIREAVGDVSLDDLFLLAYQHSLLHLIRSRKRLHPDTVSVWNALVGDGDRP